MFKRMMLALVLGAALTVPAQAEEGDLKQTVSDLTSQTTDKEKMDSRGATKVELSQIRGWVAAAQNAIQEEEEEKTRRFFQLIRAQLKLVDELIALSRVEAQLSEVEQQIAGQKQQIAEAEETLKNKEAKLRALKMKDSM